eukprot:scaffold3448_cov107-Isochrysis_galbana.AAC.6
MTREDEPGLGAERAVECGTGKQRGGGAGRQALDQARALDETCGVSLQAQNKMAAVTVLLCTRRPVRLCTHQERGDKVEALCAALERQHDAQAEGEGRHERPATSQCRGTDEAARSFGIGRPWPRLVARAEESMTQHNNSNGSPAGGRDGLLVGQRTTLPAVSRLGLVACLKVESAARVEAAELRGRHP